MARKSSQKAAGPATRGLVVASRRPEGFRRAGLRFGPEQSEPIPLSELSDDDVAALKAEPQLVVVEVDIPAPAETATT